MYHHYDGPFAPGSSRCLGLPKLLDVDESGTALCDESDVSGNRIVLMVDDAHVSCTLSYRRDGDSPNLASSDLANRYSSPSRVTRNTPFDSVRSHPVDPDSVEGAASR